MVNRHTNEINDEFHLPHHNQMVSGWKSIQNRMRTWVLDFKHGVIPQSPGPTKIRSSASRSSDQQEDLTMLRNPRNMKDDSIVTGTDSHPMVA